MRILRALWIALVIFCEALLGILASFLLKKVSGDHSGNAWLSATNLAAEQVDGLIDEIGFILGSQDSGSSDKPNFFLQSSEETKSV